jgi:hypothetical protein
MTDSPFGATGQTVDGKVRARPVYLYWSPQTRAHWLHSPVN